MIKWSLCLCPYWEDKPGAQAVDKEDVTRDKPFRFVPSSLFAYALRVAVLYVRIYPTTAVVCRHGGPKLIGTNIVSKNG